MLQFSRRSRDEPAHAMALARGAVAACAVVPLRLLAIIAVLTPAVALASLRYLVAPAVVGAIILLTGLRTPAERSAVEADTRSPLNVLSSLRMAAFLTVALAAVEWVRTDWGSQGVLTSAAALGFGDTDALTVSMARMGRAGDMVDLAAQGVAVGLLSNTAFKMAFALVLGTPKFRAYAALGLGLMGVAIGVGFLV
jgi:uncharacterized membrane protein (DUF4010 family)